MLLCDCSAVCCANTKKAVSVRFCGLISNAPKNLGHFSSLRRLNRCRATCHTCHTQHAWRSHIVLPARQDIVERVGELAFWLVSQSLLRRLLSNATISGRFLRCRPCDAPHCCGRECLLDRMQRCNALKQLRWRSGLGRAWRAYINCAGERELHVLAFGQSAVAGIASHLPDASEAIKMDNRALCLAVRA
jgi:hypothetical protein